jgi:hypothetical protein
MRHRIVTLLVLLALALAACGGDSEDTTTTGGPGGTGDDPPATGDLDIEVVVLAEGVPPLDGPPAVRAYAPDDPAAAALFVDPDAAAEALADADLGDRTLLGGVVHTGCFPAGGVAVEVIDDAVTFRAEGLDDQEGDVECYRAIVTSAVVAVATADLPDGFDEPEGPVTTTSEPDVEVDGPAAGGDDVPGEVVLVEPIAPEPTDGAGPGLVRDRVDLEALFGRYGLGEPDQELGNRLESGQSVLVAGAVTGGCEVPAGASVVRTEVGGLEWVYDVAEADPERVCDEAVSALVVVAVDPADVEGVETVDGDPADGPVGVGVVQAVEPVAVGAEPLAGRLADTDLAALPMGPDLDLPATDGDAVRLVFVVEACQPDSAELIADLSAGTVRAEAQQSGDRVDCDAESPYLVIADLRADHADLEPVIA